MVAQVFWCVLLERAVLEPAVQSLMNIAAVGHTHGHHRIMTAYRRTDDARNQTVHAFLHAHESMGFTPQPNDTLVMLDCDHLHPPDVVVRLAQHPQSVVAALAYRRCHPFNPCAWRRMGAQLQTAQIHEHSGIQQVTIAGTGAVAIKRWVFGELDKHEFDAPYFRYDYVPGSTVQPGEDMHFGLICEASGIPHFIDTDTVIPHLNCVGIDGQWYNQPGGDGHREVKEWQESKHYESYRSVLRPQLAQM
jgi:hypothetical protein